MKKTVISLVAIIAVLVIAAIVYVLTNLDSLVEAAIEKYGSQATRTTVQVEKVRIKLREGDGAIFGLSVANPSGFDLPNAIELDETGLGVDINSLGSEPYVIKHVTVRGPRVFFEVNNDKKINLNILKNNLTSGKATAQTREPAGGSQDTSQAPRIVIQRLTFEQGGIQAKLTPLEKDYQLKLPSIKMSNLGGKQGATPKELAREILERLIDAAKAEVKKKGIDAELEKLKAQADEKIQAEKQRLKQEADSKLESEKQKAEDKLKSLIK